MKLSLLFHTISTKMSSKGFILRLALAAILSIILLFVVFIYAKPEDVLTAIRNIPPSAVLIGFLFYLGSTLFRAMRFHHLHTKIRTRVFFSIASIHTFLTNMLPARAGELTFPLLVRSVDDTPMASTFSMLVLARIFDMMAIFVLFLASVGIVFGQLDPSLHTPILLISLAFLGLLCVLVGILSFGHRTLRFARRLLFFDGLKNNKLSDFIFAKLELVLDGMSIVKNARSLLIISLFSLGIWVCNYATAYVVVRGLGLTLPLWVLVLGFTFSTLVSSLPIHGLGSFGTLEAAWAVIFVLFGAPQDIAISSGFGFHIFTLLYLLVLCLVGIVHLVWVGRDRKEATGGGASEKAKIGEEDGTDGR